VTVISILGAGPAGTAAAIAARQDGAACRLIEKSKLPRHKVCGEFFSPEIQPELEALGVWDSFEHRQPARIGRMRLVFARREKTAALPEAAWGLSRFAFDALMLDRARSLGATLVRKSDVRESGDAPVVIASGRTLDDSPRGRRLFGFKAHFEGPASDTVELYFFRGCYVGVAPIESGRTNVCGLGPEDFFRKFDFDFDAVVRQSPAIEERLRPMTRLFAWLSTGPLKYAQAFGKSEQYLAGDALSFVDPFTGSGLVAAVRTGALAGVAAARGEAVSAHAAHCRAALKQPFEFSSLFRKAVDNGLAEHLIGLLPARALFALTRPRKAGGQ
jgi:menaquinone-9 beta-reductase